VPGGSPENFTALGVSGTSVQLRWDGPAKHLRHGDIVQYELLYHRVDRPLDGDFALNTTDTTVVVDGLAVNHDYIFRLRAYTAKGSGPWTSRLPFKTFANRQYTRSLPTRAYGRSADKVVGCVCVFVCLCVRVAEGKRLELSTPNLVDIETYTVITVLCISIRDGVTR